MEHLDSIQGVFSQVFSHKVQLFQDVRRNGDDVTADLLGMEYVQQLARTGPYKLEIRIGLEYLHRFSHELVRIHARVCDPSRENRYIAGRAALEAGNDVTHLVERGDRSDVEPEPLSGELL